MVKVIDSSLNILNMKTRIPFKYGMATLTSVPHLFVALTVNFNGIDVKGIAADGLAPKWFTKNKQSSFKDDINEMLLVIKVAVETAQSRPASDSVFDLWIELYGDLRVWGRNKNLPSLLTSFGVSLVERALINAACKAENKSFSDALLEGTLGFDLSRLSSLDTGLEEVINPLDKVAVRHTVGLSDPILDEEAESSPCDGLPHSLESNIKKYGLNRLKIKLSGVLRLDLNRLEKIFSIIDDSFFYTLDGNEFFTDTDEFKRYWADLNTSVNLSDRLLFVEQPFHRNIALLAKTGKALTEWSDRPKIIIDESDDEIGSANAALNFGYAGTSHKNCKGVFKSVANACLMNEKGGILSAEDLCNVGPIALLQDLSVVAALGITHVERNGHHYMKGLSMYPEDIQAAVLKCHGDLYEQLENCVSLKITDGYINTVSVNQKFGTLVEFDPTRFTALSDWDFSSLGI